jgi:hypothetical protein
MTCRQIRLKTQELEGNWKVDQTDTIDGQCIEAMIGELEQLGTRL